MSHDTHDTPHDTFAPLSAGSNGVAAEPGEWLSLPDAAARLQRHTRTVQRMVTSGQLMKRTQRGGQVELWVPLSLVPTEEAGSPDGRHTTPRDTPGASTALAVVEQQLALIERLNQLATEQSAPILAAMADARREYGALVDARDATIREQAEELGRLRAEGRALVLANLALERQVPWWRRWLG